MGRKNTDCATERCAIRISIADMLALGVRTKGTGSSPQPEFLYQALPPEALTLIATVPKGDFAVSIPGRNPFGGYPIQRVLPSSPDRFILIYKLQPNRRYEVIEVLHNDEKYGISDFYSYADRWVKNNAGAVNPLSGRFAFLAPSIKEWNVIRRDGGYIAIDPANCPAALSPEILKLMQDKDASGVVVRATLFSGAGNPSKPLPCFARVELTCDPEPGSRSGWMSYEEYLKRRIHESQPPGGIRAAFPGWLERFAADAGLESWLIRPGMFFGDRMEWWGDGNRRRSEHEGVDFAEGLDPNGMIANLPEGTPVRAMLRGEVASVLDDFLGRTVLVRHPEIVNKSGAVLYTQYSHIRPVTLLPGSTVSENQEIGHVGRLTASNAPVHFHLAAAWIPPVFKSEDLTLVRLHLAFTPIILIDLNKLIE
jgi:hypothetical protein